MHQDLYSEKFCGEGVPLWAAIPSNLSAPGEYYAFPQPILTSYSVDSNDVPTKGQCDQNNWAQYYPTLALSTAVQHLYDNYDNLLVEFGRYWSKLASIWSKTENVIGYELINEPWPGDVFQNPALYIPGVADKINLAPMYEYLNTVIRKEDPDHLVFFESVTWDDITVGFDQVPGGNNYLNRSVLSYHLYVPPNIGIEQVFTVRTREVKRLNCGGFLTEFGVANDDSQIPDFVRTMDVADQFLQSWMIWEYKAYIQITGWSWGFFNPNGSLNEHVVSKSVRTYAQAIAGRAESMYFNQETSYFKLVYLYKKASVGPTEIYVNEEYNYVKGFNVSITPAGQSWQKITPGRVLIHHSLALADQTRVEVIIQNSS
eukprot:TRINITY_DN2431_c0_g1_i1.p1 TRINITY_DN2431_c0_g1~~TRINITY_DN2431_c0_g1_i1.p1  ORF type:complete len:372 (+),score=62.72 TRINITY_DN2431_c0_g1_i1:185-1300(+)